MGSLLWGAVLYAQVTGIIELGAEDSPPEPEATEPVAEETKPDAKPQRRRRRRRPRQAGEEPFDERIGTSGDRLGGPETRHLNAAEGGGEEQLRPSEVEAGFDEAFPKITRCLMLAAGEDPVRGKLVFGLRIEGSGAVTRVNLRGPMGITKTEAGDCLRKVARNLHYRSFNGPDMVVHYPLTLE